MDEKVAASVEDDVDDILNDLSGDEGAEEAENPVERLKKAWINERAAPEILKYEEELVERVKSELETHQEFLDSADEKKGGGGLMMRIYQMEMDRINFVLKAYLRARITKIEKGVIQILSKDELSNRLSEPELDLATNYLKLVETTFKDSFLKHLPPKYNSLEDEAILASGGAQDQYVFCRSKKNLGAVSLGQGGDVTLNEDDIIVASYEPLKRLVENGDLELI